MILVVATLDTSHLRTRGSQASVTFSFSSEAAAELGLWLLLRPPSPSLHRESASPPFLPSTCHCVYISPLPLPSSPLFVLRLPSLAPSSRLVSRKFFLSFCSPVIIHWRVPARLAYHSIIRNRLGRICWNNAFAESGALLRHVENLTRPSTRALPSVVDALRPTGPTRLLTPPTGPWLAMMLSQAAYHSVLRLDLLESG